ncbi:AIM24 family protein [uncultured Methanobrevibacter sp.]|uniref:AIM24 family protein n=1 Tax=uncultured Methanobrevibacter sp. TaxID=253161 RepID=UPI0025D35249|nr:AIM24 family protein [uncultured Methanobrevibacter sp.]
MAKFCSNCGAKLDVGAGFCTQCGTKVINLEGNQATNQQTNQQPNQVVYQPPNPIDESKEGHIEIRNFVGENDNIIELDEKGPFKVIQYEKDLSVTPNEAEEKYFSTKMNVRPRQLIADLSKTSGIYLQARAMQWMSGANKLSTGVNGIGDFGKKFLKAAATRESVAKPEYSGDGFVVTEQTYKHLLLLDLNEWDNSITIDDGLFLAAEKSVGLSVQRMSDISSTFAATNLYYTTLNGDGYVCLESNFPMEELIVIEITNDTVTIDGPLAIAWTSSLQFTGERSGKTIVDSILTEGLVNVFRGTGKILMAPLSFKPHAANLETMDKKIKF